MKGRLAIRTVVLLVIAVIVIAIALYFLVYVVNFDSLFLSNDQRILKQYSTCALAYCASGAGSDEVKAVGCLKSEGGKCVLSCEQVEEKFYGFGKNPANVDPSFTELNGIRHYCGKEAALEFEFSGVSLGGTVPLQSGQMDKLANKPQWVCKSLKIPLFNIEIDDIIKYVPFTNLPGIGTADIQYVGGLKPFGIPISPTFSQNCIMLSKSEPDIQAYSKTIVFLASLFITKRPLVAGGAEGAAELGGLTSPYESAGLKTKGGCFTGFVYDNVRDEIPSREDILYTPIVQYNSQDEKVYPSAIYIDKSFTQPIGGSQPECLFVNPKLAILRNSNGYDLGKINQLISDSVSKYKNDHKDDYKDILGKKIPGTDKDFTENDRQEKIQNDAINAAYADIGEDPIVGLDIFGPFINQFEYGNVIRECKLKTTFKGKKIKYSVWSSPTFPGEGTLVGLKKSGEQVVVGAENVVDNLLDFSASTSDSIRTGFDPLGLFSQIGETSTLIKLSIDNLIKLISQLIVQPSIGASTNAFSQFGSCASVTLERDLKGTPITTEDIAKEAEKLQFSEPVLVNGIAKVATANSETSPFALVDSQKIYLFFERTTGDAFKPSDVSKEIWYTVSEDGGSTWQETKRITDYSTGIAGSEPSAVVFNGKIYIAYKEKSFGQGVKIETKNFIVVKELGGAYEKRFADVETNDRGGPSMAVSGGRLYLFFHQKGGPLAGGDFFKILYTSWDGNANNDWQALTLVPTPTKDSVPNFLNSPNTWSMYPNALVTSNGIVLSYSYSAQTGQIGPFHEAFDVRAVRFDGKGTSEDLGEISADESGTDIPNRRQGFSHLVEKNGEIFVFYDEDDIARAGKAVDPTEAEFKSHINYKKYNPDSGWDVFPTSLFETKSKALQPTPVTVGDKILLFLSSNEGSSRWDLLSSLGEKKIVLTQVPNEPDFVQGISGKTDKDSYKKGETTKFVGSLTMTSGKPEGKKVRIVLKFGPAELLSQDVAATADGSFVWEYALPAGVARGTYEIVASSGGKEVSYKFAVTG